MTQPVQEPSTDRALQGFAYARDQIFRRPAPRQSTNVPWLRRCKFYGAALTVPGVFLDDEVTLGSGVGNGPDDDDGSDDWMDYWDLQSNFQVQHLINGFIEIWIGVLWEDNFNAPSWFYVHDGEGFPDETPSCFPTNYGQLGGVSTGYWKQRMGTTNLGPLQVDVAQLSGMDQVVDAWYIEFRWQGSYTGPDRDQDSDCLP